MARTLQEQGFNVDVISYTNLSFRPSKDYSLIVDTRENLQRLSPFLSDQCLKIMHIDSAHILFSNRAELDRLFALQERRHVTLTPRRFQTPNLGIESAHCATLLGNRFTADTFRYACKPLYPVPVSSPHLYDWPANKDFRKARKTFMWLGSGGLVHKGLDLVLEAFAQMSDFQLIVCGPVANEPDFAAAYHHELYETRNIEVVGWTEMGSPLFTNLAMRCAGMVYPSCSEGQCGSVVTAMHAGLIPICSYESGVDVAPFGTILHQCSIGEIQRSVEAVAALDPLQAAKRARDAWQYARSVHTRENFGREYRRAMNRILSAGELGLKAHSGL
jgi:glycosyltransferase involved in cell wall biosynthesis